MMALAGLHATGKGGHAHMNRQGRACTHEAGRRQAEKRGEKEAAQSATAAPCHKVANVATRTGQCPAWPGQVLKKHRQHQPLPHAGENWSENINLSHLQSLF